VISDIDDTIKITEIPAGREIVLRNTFFRDFVQVPEVAQIYRGLGNASFHYVSGGPWELFQPLTQFLINAAHFPEGTFHLKTVPRSPLAAGSWDALKAYVDAGFNVPELTKNQKLVQIRRLMTNLPDSTFVLFGDSGEKDPEVYFEIQDEFSNQVTQVTIRDVVDARTLHKQRFALAKGLANSPDAKSMTVRAAPTIEKGVSTI
jgi:phosphatidate phosphatase APP1